MERDINAITPGKIILIVLLLIVIIFAIYIFIPKETNKKNEKEPKLIHLKFDDTIQNNILFSDIKIFKQENEFYLTAKATNLSSNELKISPVTITLKDKENKKTVLTSYIGDILTGENEKNIIIKTNKDLKNTKNIDIKITAQVQTWAFSWYNKYMSE